MLLQHCRWFAALLALAAAAQTFDAASVKPFDRSLAMTLPPAERRNLSVPSGGPGTRDPGRIHYPGVSLQFLVLQAYGLNTFELQAPDWLDAERFLVDATLPPQTTPAQFRAMLRNLLTERFQFSAHFETKDLPGFTLVLAPGKPKLKPSQGPPAPPGDGSPPELKLGPGNYFVPPDRQGVFLQLTGLHSARSTFRQVTMPELARTLQNQLKQPVADTTGLAGPYDFTLSYATEGLYLGSGRIPIGPAAEESAPDLSAALKEQLGLKLESRKITTRVLVVDRVEKTPTGN